MNMKKQKKLAWEVDDNIFMKLEEIIEAGRKVKTERSKASLPPGTTIKKGQKARA